MVCTLEEPCDCKLQSLAGCIRRVFKRESLVAGPLRRFTRFSSSERSSLVALSQYEIGVCDNWKPKIARGYGLITRVGTHRISSVRIDT